MRIVPALSVLALLALSACATARPADTRLPAAFEAPAGEALDAQALDRWWTTFDDPELTALVDQALAAAPDARSAAARLDEARATATGGLTSFLPQGQLTGSTRKTHTEQLDGTVINIPGFSTSGASESQAANFNVSWELDLFGRFFAARRAARGDRAAARFNYEGARASLAANVADGYFQVRGLAIQLADARETARIQHALQALANTRAERGLGSAADADRVAGEVAQADGQVANLEAELQAARRALLILVGRGIEPTTNLPAVAGVGKIPAVPASVPSDLLRRRPDIREAEARVQSAAGRLAAAQMAFLPTFDLTPGLGWSKNEQPGFSSTSQNWSMGVNVSQPILNIPTLLLQMRAQDARTEQAVIAYEKTVQAAFGEAESSLVRLASDRRRVGLLTDGEMRAGRAYEASRVRYAAGIDDLQTALGAEQGWRATRSQLTAAQVQALRRAVQAMKALGGGWQAETIPTNAQAR